MKGCMHMYASVWVCLGAHACACISICAGFCTSVLVGEWLSSCVMCICVCGHERMCIHMYLGGLDCMCVWAEMHAGVHACEYMGSYLLTNMCLPTQKAG